ncbi:MauE/DoxX family redox-associated membrane protein [Janthinobacterium sp. JC611]|uniref:MauE/DoxX family redox-associated membrane protein n=1 Tax=Janthinobacterium sp. JC611 TaxID=2816201 RepID=UPI001BFD02EA|nr:MauE/DoxX family redox-associated membrane protein [Janthinobacterium sp. JC611]
MLTPLLGPSLAALLADTARYCIALLLLAASVGKLRGYSDFRGNLATSFGVPPAAASLAAPALVMAELLLSGWLLAGGIHIPMLLSLLLLTTLTAILAWRYFTHSVVRCSCFGEAARPVSRYDLLRNMLVVGINGAYFALEQETTLPVAGTALAAGLAAIVCVATISLHDIATLAKAY